MAMADDSVQFVIQQNVKAMSALRKSHGDHVAAVMARGLMAAGARMLASIHGERVAAWELYQMASNHADRAPRQFTWPSK
jgi:hypothetical protein